MMKYLLTCLAVILVLVSSSIKVTAPRCPLKWDMTGYTLVQKITFDNGLTVEVWRPERS
jgi:hypothetical protein